MKKVLILTASFGDGHNAAARNIRDALEIVDPSCDVDVVDLLQVAYGRLNQMARATYLRLIRHAPSAWHAIYNLLESSPGATGANRWARLRNTLDALLAETQPDCVISTYPLYGEILERIHEDRAERPFRLLTVITDSISIHSAWFRAPSDLFCVANEASAEVLLSHGVERRCIAVTGFPVPPSFQSQDVPDLPPPAGPHPRRILYVINAGSRKTGRTLEEILELPGTELTVTTGRDVALKAKLQQRLAPYGDRARLFGWTNLMPQLLATHHLVVTKAGGATVQEAIAARCPMIINQTVPGQEEGNAHLVRKGAYGCVIDHPGETAAAVRECFADDARVWRAWRRNLSLDCRPGAAFRIAEIALQADGTDRPPFPGPGRDPHPAPERTPSLPQVRVAQPGFRSLLCDFHIHTNYSDGRLTVAEVVDFYGAHGFDCICITDHLADPRRLIGKLSRLSRLTICPAQLEEYFEVIRHEAARAWRRYRMLVLAGIEFNKDGYTSKTSAHLLGVDLKHPIAPDLDLPETIARIHDQGGLAIASHPHVMKSEWGKNTLFLWENQDTYAPLLDAWEIANRDNLFAPVARKRLPFIANSDFHKPRHIYSWKTILHCEKDPEAIKDCIRRNEQVSITLYRPRDAGTGEGRVIRPAFAATEARPASPRRLVAS